MCTRPRAGFFALLWNQCNNCAEIILIIAALVSLLTGQCVDSIATMFIVVLTSVIDVVQESRPEETLVALNKRR
ncbi:MAG: hypothetical protein ACT4PQ_13480 [Betaproteobacteria bacterium]